MLSQTKRISSATEEIGSLPFFSHASHSSSTHSLQATYIRNTLLRAIRETDKDAAKRLPMNLVFAHPTITSLARAVLGVLDESLSNGHISHRPHTPADLWKYVEKYSANFPARPPNLVDRPEGKDVVLITGTTGGFGCDTLEHLLRDERVGTVYAFNRKNARALERQREQFRARGLDETLLDLQKFRLIEATLHEPGFGLEPSLFSEVRAIHCPVIDSVLTGRVVQIQRSVTQIMHNGGSLVPPCLTSNSLATAFASSMEGRLQPVPLVFRSGHPRRAKSGGSCSGLSIHNPAHHHLRELSRHLREYVTSRLNGK